MPRLLRPHIPIETRCRVAMRQLRDLGIAEFKDGWDWRTCDVPYREGGHKRLLDGFLYLLATRAFRCEVKDLRLDHDPALGARAKVFRKGEHVGYKPDANDPDHLAYRPHGAEFEGSHLVKTNVRGDGAQYPDRVLIKRERRRERKRAKPSKGGKIKQRPSKWAARPLKGANRWPPKGSRKFQRRR